MENTLFIILHCLNQIIINISKRFKRQKPIRNNENAQLHDWNIESEYL